MKMLAFAKRNAREILRDPLTLVFGLGFPVILLLLLTVIQRNIPVSLFELASLTPGLCVFGLSFLTLFSATVIARDRETALAARLCTTPLSAMDFILGYALPILPFGLLQGAVCYGVALLLGLTPTWHILGAIAALLPAAWFFIALGLLFGSVLGVKQVGGMCGALLTNVTAWLSGVWFDISLLGATFEKIASCLPFLPAVEMGRAALAGNYGGMLPQIFWVAGYAVVVSFVAVLLYLRQMRNR